MAVFVASLNSGSNGNCYYIGNLNEAVLIDAGISCRETEKRLVRLNLDIKKVKGIFVSHEHGDHVHGITALSRRHSLPVYITPETERLVRNELPASALHPFRAYEPISIGNLTITGFPKYHDAIDPHSFIITSPDPHQEKMITVGVFTDIGEPCDHVLNHFSQCHAAFLEANYDDHMLECSAYPYSLKQRIRGGRGHLSNAQALKVFTDHRPSHMSHLFLAHLSQHNNKPELVQELFDRHAGNTKIVVASRHRETDVYAISDIGKVNEAVRVRNRFYHQLELFR